MRRHAIVIVMQAGRSGRDLLRHWRQPRRSSQLDLPTDAQISAKHLCFLETGRSQPSRDTLLHLAEHLQDKIGTIAEGMLADIVAIAGNPLDDIAAVRKVAFVMKSGRVYKH
jgi:transcriptional regulator with XRE-family HTH domain